MAVGVGAAWRRALCWDLGGIGIVGGTLDGIGIVCGALDGIGIMCGGLWMELGSCGGLWMELGLCVGLWMELGPCTGLSCADGTPSSRDAARVGAGEKRAEHGEKKGQALL